MKTKDEFLARYTNELSGMLLASFTKAEQHTDPAWRGRWMLQHLNSVDPLLRGMYEFIMEEVAKLPEPQTIDEQADEFLRRYMRAPQDTQKKMVEKFRAAMTKPSEVKP